MTAGPDTAIVATLAMPVEQARRLSDAIRGLADSIAGALDELVVLVNKARTGGADIALGYASWTAYLADVMPPVRTDSRDERQLIVAYLREQGLSTRAIAPIVGVHHSTVAEDLSAVGNPTPAVDETPPPITGLDGKAYPPRPRPVVDPAPPPPPRPSGSPPTDEERAASDRRAADAIRKFLYGWPIAINLQRSANRDRTLAALDPHDRERFLAIEQEHLR